MSSRAPPRYVPTLTDVVGMPQGTGPASGLAAQANGLSQEELVQRVMERIDLMLERRLREAIAASVIEQTRNVTPALREEIEAVVRQMISQAFEKDPAIHKPG
jgi:hypothetical protein